MKSKGRAKQRRTKKPVSFWKLFDKSLLVPVIVVGVAVVVLAGLGLTQLLKDGSPARPAGQLVAPNVWQSFTSEDYRFRVDFSGTPTEHEASFTFDGRTVPMKFYVYGDEDEGTSEAVQVAELGADYEEVTDGEQWEYLEGTIKGVAASTGAIQASRERVTFLGQRAVKISYELRVEEDVKNIFMLSFVHDGSTFIILSGGKDKAAFETFLSSFELF